MGFAEEQARRDAELAAGMSSTALGICVGYRWDERLIVVNVGGAEQSMAWSGEPPWRGMRVQVSYLAGVPRATAQVGSAMGTVQAVVAGDRARVLGDDGELYTYPFPFGLGINAGHRVLLDHLHQAVTMRYSAEPIGSGYLPPPAPPAPTGGAATFNPIDSGNYRYGTYDGQAVEISISRSAAYWYGAQIAQTLPDGAAITKAVLRLSEVWDEVEGTDTLIRLHGQQTRGAEPGLFGPSIPVRGSGEVDIRGTFIDQLKTGAAWGVGFQRDTGWRRFDSFTRSGGIYVEWTGS